MFFRYEYFTTGFNLTQKLGITNITETNINARNSNNSTKIKTKNVLRVAREYYGCANISGVELENEGSDGTSHWESVFLHNEIMTSTPQSNWAFSNFTLALLEDSGWYKVDYTKAE